jgi:FkbM family methyltransferase
MALELLLAVRRLVKKLDRRGGRTLLSLVGSAGLTMSLRKATTLRWRDGAWVYKWSGANIPHPTVGSALHPEQARRIFTYAYAPKPGDVVVDVGAGYGDSSLLFSRLVGETGKVVAIEAHPETYEWLVRLCELNHLTNTLALQSAASDHEGEILISDADGLSNTVLETSLANPRVAVPGRRLDRIAEELGIEHIDLVKMNIEGAERDALKGMEQIIHRTRSVCISCHDFMAERGGPETMRTRAFVIDFLQERGFSVTSREAGDEVARSYVYGMNTEWPD